jgi:hypothetical protein
MFYSMLGVKLLSTLDYQESWHMHGVYVSCHRWRQFIFTCLITGGTFLDFGIIFLWRTLELVQWCLPNSSPIVCFSLHTITSMKCHCIKVKIVHMLGIACLFTYWEFMDNIVALILKFTNGFCVSFEQRDWSSNVQYFFKMVSSGMVCQIFIGNDISYE